MQKKGANISLKGYDDIFSTDQSRAEAQQERVQEIPLSELHPFEGHPFRVVDDEEMMKPWRVFETSVFLPRRLSDLILTVAMKSFPVTGDIVHLSLPGKKPCLLLSVIWTMMQPSS